MSELLTSCPSTGGGGFYGLLVKESESGGFSQSSDEIVFDSSYFYVSSSGNSKPLVSLIDGALDSRYVNIDGDTMTGNLLLPDGSISAPALAFSGDTGMGIRRSGGGFIFTNDGVDILTISGSPTFLASVNNFNVGGTLTAGGVITANGGIITGAGDTITLGLGSQILGDSPAVGNINPTYAFVDDTTSGVYLDEDHDGIGIAIRSETELVVKRDAVLVRGGFYAVTVEVPSNGRIYTGDGSATLPSYAFASDPTSGLWKIGNSLFFGTQGGTNFASVGTTGLTGSALQVSGASGASAIVGGLTLSTVGGGNLVIGSFLDSDSRVQINDGTAASPGIQFRNDTDNGMFRIGTNKLGFSAGGAKQVTVTRQAVTVAGGFYSATFGEPLYELTVQETNGGDSYDGLDSIEFEGAFFYVTPSSSSKRAIVNFIPPVVRKVNPVSVASTATNIEVFRHTLPANFLESTGAVRTRLLCNYLNNSGSNRNLTVRITFGSTVIFEDLLAITTGAATRALILEFTLGNRGISNSQILGGTMLLSGVTAPTTGIGGFAIGAGGAFTGTASEDTTLSKDIIIGISNSSTGTLFTLLHSTVERI